MEFLSCLFQSTFSQVFQKCMPRVWVIVTLSPNSSQIPFSPSFESLFFFYPPNAIVWSMESWMCDLTLEHGWPTIGSSVKENGFLSASSQQLPRSSSAGAGLPGTSSLRAGFANMGLVYAVTTIVSSYAQLPCLFI